MFPAKYQPIQPCGSGEEDFELVLPYMGMAAILNSDQNHFSYFLFPQVTSGPVVSEEKSF